MPKTGNHKKHKAKSKKSFFPFKTREVCPDPTLKGLHKHSTIGKNGQWRLSLTEFMREHLAEHKQEVARTSWPGSMEAEAKAVTRGVNAHFKNAFPEQFSKDKRTSDVPVSSTEDAAIDILAKQQAILDGFESEPTPDVGRLPPLIPNRSHSHPFSPCSMLPDFDPNEPEQWHQLTAEDFVCKDCKENWVSFFLLSSSVASKIACAQFPSDALSKMSVLEQ